MVKTTGENKDLESANTVIARSRDSSPQTVSQGEKEGDVLMSMTHGTNSRGGEDSGQQPPPRPPSVQSGSSSGSGSSKHVKCIGRYVLTGSTLGKGNFARVEAAVHTLTRGKVYHKLIIATVYAFAPFMRAICSPAGGNKDH